LSTPACPGQVADLLEEDERAFPVDRVFQLTEVHLRPVDDAEGIGCGLLVTHRFRLLDGLRAPFDGLAVLPAFLAEAPVPAEELGPLAIGIDLVDVAEDPDATGDPTQRIGVAIEPALHPGQLEEQSGLPHDVGANQPPGRPVGTGRADIAPGQVPGVTQCLVRSRHGRRRELGQPSARGDRPLEVLRRFGVGVQSLRQLRRPQ